MVKHLHILMISTSKIWEPLGSQNEKHLKMFKNIVRIVVKDYTLIF